MMFEEEHWKRMANDDHTQHPFETHGGDPVRNGLVAGRLRHGVDSGE
jgi:hypothetical protein